MASGKFDYYNGIFSKHIIHNKNVLQIWLVVSTPLKIWVRQLGWWNSQYIMENNPNVPKHQPEIADNSCCFGLGLVRSVLLVETFVKNTALQHQTFEVYVGVWHGASTYFDILEGNYYWVKIYPLVNVYKKLLKMVIEIVDLQYSLKMVIFHSYVSLPEGK